MTGWTRLFGLVAAVVLAVGWQPAGAAEVIHEFDVRIDVRPDGALEVTETIRIRAEGNEIKRGVNRDFPLAGAGGRATFDVVSVRRNGNTEPYRVIGRGGATRLRIGRADRLLPVPSQQIYEIRYLTRGQLRAFEGYDELYWDVTGDRWTFPIRAASVEIRLPANTEILQHAAYTGPPGTRGTAFDVIDVVPGLFRAVTTAPLRPGEGFTVAVGWPPGVVEISQPGMIAGQPAGRFAAVGATLIGALALFLAWVRVGRDPEDGAIYARFDPPKGVGPAAARYVQRLGFDAQCLTAAIISMATKDALRIVERPAAGLAGARGYALVALGADGKALTPGEQGAYGKLFAGGSRIELNDSNENGERIDQARSELRSQLWDEHYGASFRRNTWYTVIGALAGVAAAALLFALLDDWRLDAFWPWLLLAALAACLTYLAGFLLVEVRDLWRGGGLHWRRLWLRVTPSAVFAVIIGKFLIDIAPGVLAVEVGRGDLLVQAAAVVFGITAGLFHFLMAAPTKAGRRLMDQIDGFALYLRTAEEDRLNILNPPERTPELFERLLPYAVALGLAHEWSAKFADVLSATTAPDWYEGTGRFDIDDFGGDFGNAIASTTHVANVGGSGGGGFSGGGGGGGGGSGW